MKIKTLLFTIFLLVFISSCRKDNHLIKKEDEINNPYLNLEQIDLEQIVSKNNQSITIPVNGNINYTIQSFDSWIEAPSEVEAGKNFTINLSDNNNESVRKSWLILSAKGIAPILISVKQGGNKPYILTAPSEVNLNTNLQFKIKIISNIQYDLDLPFWIEKDSSLVEIPDHLFYKAEESHSDRDGKIILRGKDPNNNITDKILINQLFNPDLAPRFAVISDTHMKINDADASKNKIEKALSYLSTENLDAIFIVGDVTDNGHETEYQRMVNSVTTSVPKNIPVYYTSGNHDLYNDSKSERFIKHFGQNPNQYLEIKGHPFILVGMNKSSQPYYDNTASNFLKEKLEYAAKKFPKKPIFVLYHVGVQNTVYGTNTNIRGESWGSSYLENIMNAYPQAIAFSGHSHFPLGDERSIHQQKFTSINDGHLTYGEIENGFVNGIHPERYEEVTEGVIVSAQDNEQLKSESKYYKNFIIQRLDLYRNTEIKDPWIIKAPHDGSAFSYKDRKGSVPTFRANTSIKIEDVTLSSAKVKWPQATSSTSYDKVHHYEVKVFDARNNEISSNRIFSLFYLNKDQPDSLQYTIKELKPNSNYKVKIVAVDSWYTNRSAPIEIEFTTKDFIINSTSPIADLFDINYTNKEIKDYSINNFNITAGNGPIKYSFNNELNQYMATYTNNESSMHRLNYINETNFISKFTKAFTLEVYYKNTNINAEIDIIGALETGGIGIEQAKGGGATKLWIRTNGSYKMIGKTITNKSDYYHMIFTYDGKKVIAYTNGLKVDELDVTGTVQLPTNSSAHWFAISGDASTTENVQGSMDGDIVFTRLYSTAISENDAFLLHKQIMDRKTMKNFPALKEALEKTIPFSLIPANEQKKIQIKKLEEQGWALMRKYSTTDNQISQFLIDLNKVINF